MCLNFTKAHFSKREYGHCLIDLNVVCDNNLPEEGKRDQDPFFERCHQMGK
jgi:hypothetical protein